MSEWKDVLALSNKLAQILERTAVEPGHPFSGASVMVEEFTNPERIRVSAGWQQVEFTRETTILIHRVVYFENSEFQRRVRYEGDLTLTEPGVKDYLVRGFIDFIGVIDSKRGTEWSARDRMDLELKLACEFVGASLNLPVTVERVSDLETFVRVEGQVKGSAFRLDLDSRTIRRGGASRPGVWRDEIAAGFRRALAERG